MAQRIRIVLADDHPRSRGGLRAVLALNARLAVVGEAATGREAIKVIAQVFPDVVLIDVEMPEMDGLEATRVMKARWPDIRVIALSMYAAHADDAHTAGADVFVSKADPPERLVTAILKVMAER